MAKDPFRSLPGPKQLGSHFPPGLVFGVVADCGHRCPSTTPHLRPTFTTGNIFESLM